MAFEDSARKFTLTRAVPTCASRRQEETCRAGFGAASGLKEISLLTALAGKAGESREGREGRDGAAKTTDRTRWRSASFDEYML